MQIISDLKKSTNAAVNRVPTLAVQSESSPRVMLDIPTPTLDMDQSFLHFSLLDSPTGIQNLDIDIESSKFALAKVIRDHVAKNQEELNLEEDDIVKIYSTIGENGRLFGGINDLTGWLPTGCVVFLTRDQIENEKLPELEASTSNSIEQFQPSPLHEISLNLNEEVPKQWFTRKIKSEKPNNSITRPKSVPDQNGDKTGNNRAPGQRQLWKDIVGKEALDKLGITKDEIKRQEVIWEIISTEKDFMQDLEIICEVSRM